MLDKSNMSKLKSQYQDLTKALKRLQEILKEPKTDIVRDATIKRFDIAFEAAGKIIHSVLKLEGINVYGTKTIIRAAAQVGLIDNPEAWFKFLETRMLTIYAYDDALAEKIFLKAEKFPKSVENLLAAAKVHLDS